LRRTPTYFSRVDAKRLQATEFTYMHMHMCMCMWMCMHMHMYV
jgi:hypothetical protein